ncbi:hypothetical protein C8J57DRAFT_1584279 [Mycena rebaudengoi]|nr:hypothetical protein C8J57DRAFT_1584279 [Mycena rebaudengoi]
MTFLCVPGAAKKNQNCARQFNKRACTRPNNNTVGALNVIVMALPNRFRKAAMLLLDLNYDVLLRIFTYFDVASVLQSARVSSACKRLAQSKHVWLAIVLDLGCRHLLDLPPRDTLRRFSTMQLMEEVKRAVLGPRTWAPNSSSAPTIRRKIHVSMSGPSRPTLLSGDKHLLVQRGTGCEIWDITEGHQIWAHDGIVRRNFKVVAQPVHDGTQLLIVLCTGQPQLWEVRLLTPPNYHIVIEVFLLDLKTSLESPMPPIQLPRTCSAFSDPMIAGDMWCANIQWFPPNGDPRIYGGALLVNWRKAVFVLLHYPVQLLHKNILCGHLLALEQGGTKSSVLLYLSASFDPHWKPLDSIMLARATRSPVRIEPIILLQQVEYPDLPGFRTPRMSVHDCPLHRGSYVVSTHCATNLPTPDRKIFRREIFRADCKHLLCDPVSRPPALHRYRLTLASSPTKSTWERISSTGTVDSVLMESFTYAGYGLSFGFHGDSVFPRLVCRPVTGMGTVYGTWAVPIPEENSDSVFLSPDTGALTICSERGVDVYYYE